MKKIILNICIILLLTACNSDQKNSQVVVEEKEVVTPTIKITLFSEKNEIFKAQKSISVFSISLKNELMSAIKSGGPVAAINRCNTKASKITSHISDLNGMQISRTSLKNRNSNNAPTKWQKSILESFEVRKRKGEDIKTISYAEIIEENGTKQFRFLKAIPTQSNCLICHGKKISKDVKKRLKALYPNDNATGFKEGDIRGAFVVVNNL